MTWVAPTGWPDRVPPPVVDGWRRWAADFLFDCCPPDYRRHRVLHRHPIVLAAFARRYVAMVQAGADAALADLRVELTEVLSPLAQQEAVDAWLAETAALARTARAVRALEAALADDERGRGGPPEGFRVSR